MGSRDRSESFCLTEPTADVSTSSAPSRSYNCWKQYPIKNHPELNAIRKLSPSQYRILPYGPSSSPTCQPLRHWAPFRFVKMSFLYKINIFSNFSNTKSVFELAHLLYPLDILILSLCYVYSLRKLLRVQSVISINGYYISVYELIFNCYANKY